MIRRTVLLATVLGMVGCGPPPPSTPTERVTIPTGASFAAITDTLVRRGVLNSPRWFRLAARMGNNDRNIKSGVYDLPRGASAWWILRTLRTGRAVLSRITVPEGVTIVELAALADSLLGTPADSVLAAARDTSLLQEFGVSAPTMEGFLHPETYFVSTAVTGRALVRQMAEAFRAGWDPAWDTAAESRGMSRTGFVTVASIVEGEAQVAEERPIIAAVYLNRLRIGMPLQADPTVQYAIQLRTGARKPRLFLRDYEVESPYNTYLIPGLPPGPVALPGREALRAVAQPADVPYLYFVAADSGRHIFSRTYAEHLAAIRRVRRGR